MENISKNIWQTENAIESKSTGIMEKQKKI